MKSFWRGAGIDHSEGAGWFGLAEGFGGVAVAEAIVTVAVLLVYEILNVRC